MRHPQADRASGGGRRSGGGYANAVRQWRTSSRSAGASVVLQTSASSAGASRSAISRPTRGPPPSTIDADRIATPSPRAARSATALGRAGLQCDVRPRPPRRAAAVEDRADAGALGHADHGVGGNVGQRHALAARQQVMAGAAATSRSLMTGKPSRPGGHRGRARQREVGLPATTRSMSRSERVLDQRQLDAGVGRVERRQRVEQRRHSARGDHADHEPAAQHPGDLVDGLADGAGRREDRPGVLERRRARGRQRRRAPRAVDQLGAELLLEPSDLGADPGLADVHALGRAGEVGLLGDRHEVLELPQLHKH